MRAGEERALVRTDIITALARLHRARPEAGIDRIVQELMDEEEDPTARRKQRASWIR